MQYQQNSTDFLFEMDKFTLKFVWKFKVSRIVKTILKKMNKFGGLSICDYKAYFKPIVLRQCGNSIGKNKDQWNTTEFIIAAHLYRQLIFDQFTKSF